MTGDTLLLVEDGISAIGERSGATDVLETLLLGVVKLQSEASAVETFMLKADDALFN